jgi:hypothetical protein
MTSFSINRRLLAVALAVFVALLGAAMACYPGGDWVDTQSSGYRFWDNFLCDLLFTEAINGEANTAGSVLAALAAMELMVFGWVPIWWRVRTCPKTARVCGALSAVFGLVMCIQVLADLPIPHGFLLLLYGGFGVVASTTVMLDLQADPGTSAAVKVTGLLALGSALGGALLDALIRWTGVYDKAWMPGVQKIILILSLIWLLALILFSRGLDQGSPRNRD